MLGVSRLWRERSGKTSPSAVSRPITCDRERQRLPTISVSTRSTSLSTGGSMRTGSYSPAPMRPLRRKRYLRATTLAWGKPTIWSPRSRIARCTSAASSSTTNAARSRSPFSARPSCSSVSWFESTAPSVANSLEAKISRTTREVPLPSGPTPIRSPLSCAKSVILSAFLPNRKRDSAFASLARSWTSGSFGNGIPACTNAAPASHAAPGFARRATLSIEPEVATFSTRPRLLAAATATWSTRTW